MSSRPRLATVSRRPANASAPDGGLTALEAERDRLAAECARLARDAADARAASDAKDRFLAILSHDLRAPLARIVLALDMIERGLVPPERLSEALTGIRRHVGAEARIIEDVLETSRVVGGTLRLERRPVDVHAVLDDAVAAARPQAADVGVSIARALDARQHVVDGDEARLRRVASELVENAVRHTPRGGRIRIATRDGAGTLVVEVRDTGRGFAREAADRLFRAFAPLHPPGDGARRRVGLGLAICRGIVLAHDGRIAASSPGPGKGATFTVELPRGRAARG